MANLQTLAPYLAAGIEVEHKLHGRGLLHGLPSHHIGEGGGQLASVRFVREGSSFPDWYTLESVKPVLYAPEDFDKLGLLHTAPESLEIYARLVDAARALGIALNISETDYIRKELPCSTK